jgi:hypothetical protein
MLAAAESLSSITPTAGDILGFLDTLRNLVMLIHYLEFAITQATSKVTSASSPPYSSCVFFIAQKTLFRDWVSRIRRHLITAAHYTSIGSSWIVFHGERYLVEAARGMKGSVRGVGWLDSFTGVWVLLGKAYADLGDYDGLKGVLGWCRENLRDGLKDTGRDFTFYEGFFKACCMIAKVFPLILYG